MKVLLATLNAKYIHSSLALRYLQAYSKQDFGKIEIAEYSIKEPIHNILADMYKKKPTVLGLSCYIWNIEETITLVRMLKKVLPELSIIVGGPEVSYDIEYWLKSVKEIDYIVYGEGEDTFLELLKALRDDRDISSINGLAYRKEMDIIINPPREKLKLDLIPSPYQNEEDLKDLRDKIVYFEASRGCPFSCAYCLSSIETGVRFYSIERIKADLLTLINSGVKTIKFVDRTFNTNKNLAMEIFQFLIENHQNTIFQFEITADIMNKEVLEYLVKHAPEGIFRFEIGIQSTNEYTNSLISRRQNFKRLSETVLILKESKKIAQHLDLIAGLPEEDYGSFRNTFNDVFALRPDELQLGFLKMLRGTPIWYDAAKYAYKYMDQAPYEILANNVLHYEDVIKIKAVEDILEKYWNSHRMDRTISYLIDEEFETPFDFFQEFGEYWEQKGWNRIGHQLEALFERLIEFLKYRNSDHLKLILGLMKIDYFMNHQYRPRKTWWDYDLNKKEQADIMKDITTNPNDVADEFAMLQLSEKEAHKHLMIDISDYDIEAYFKKHEIIQAKTLIIVYFNSPNKPSIYFKRI